MVNAYDLWKKGLSGSHHVWGKVELEKNDNIKVILFEQVKYKFLNSIGKLFRIKNLDQQIRVLFYTQSFDILYAPYSTANTRFLLLLKAIGLFKKPIVAAVHQPFLGTNSNNKWERKLAKFLLLQFDKTIFLSENLLLETVNRLEIPDQVADEKFTTAQWGPDTQFYNKLDLNIHLEACEYAISAGHTDRDYETLINAFKDIDFKLKIFCTPRSTPKNVKIPPNVEIHTTFIPYIELLQHYLKARMILIPMKYPRSKEGCQGMTSIQDAVALGKPTIITRNPSLNLDVEMEGFGKTVRMESVSDWVSTVNSLIHDLDALREMQIKSKFVLDNKFNAEGYAGKLEEVLFSVYMKNKQSMRLTSAC